MISDYLKKQNRIYFPLKHDLPLGLVGHFTTVAKHRALLHILLETCLVSRITPTLNMCAWFLKNSCAAHKKAFLLVLNGVQVMAA